MLQIQNWLHLSFFFCREFAPQIWRSPHSVKACIFVFLLSIPSSILLFWAVLTPLKTVYIRVPPNNSINARAPSLGLRLSLFSEVSYTRTNFNNRYIAESIKVALGIGKLLFGGHSSKSLHFSIRPNDQLPKQPFFDLAVYCMQVILYTIH